MVFGNCGVLTEISTDKGYVEMTGIDAETSQDIAEAITAKGARYLEAQVQGSKIQAEEGTLVILAAGDRQLFDDCSSCFGAMGKNTFYLGEVGNASKMNLVLQLMAGVTLAGLAESMALADRAGLQQKDVLEILELTSLACPAILDKGKGTFLNILRHLIFKWLNGSGYRMLLT
jgi:3-hydroxyisobutyrate dehydrogenase